MTTTNTTTPVDMRAVKAAFAALDASDAELAKAQEMVEAAKMRRQGAIAQVAASIGATPGDSKNVVRGGKKLQLVFGLGKGEKHWSIKGEAVSKPRTVINLDA
jgi:hypothetical protein